MAGVTGLEPVECQSQSLVPYRLAIPQKEMVGGDGFEPPNHKELSYSPPRLASSLPPQLYLLRMVPTIGIEPTTY